MPPCARQARRIRARHRLAMPGAMLEVVLEPHPDGFGPNGAEGIDFSSRPTPGSRPRRSATPPPVGALAGDAGLDLARCRLQCRNRPVFDEIDAGVGGNPAQTVGERLRRSARPARSSASPTSLRWRRRHRLTSSISSSPCTRSHRCSSSRRRLHRASGGSPRRPRRPRGAAPSPAPSPGPSRAGSRVDASDATCGRWVMQMTCRSPRSLSRSPTVRAVLPPIPASISSKTRVPAPAAAPSPVRASITRESSPPEAASRSGAASIPGLGAS